MVTDASHAVLLHGRTIGTLLQRGDVARFVFSKDYWDAPGRPVLGLWFEDNPRQSPRAALRLPPWFSNLLPEGRLREWIARDTGVSVDRELQLLLRIGTDLPGAVQVLAHEGEATDAHGIGDIDGAPPEVSSPANIWKFSLAGVGMKFSMLRDGDRLTIPGRDGLGDWIVKFPDATFPEVPANEHFVMNLAGAVGIHVPETELVHRDSLPSLPDLLWPGSETHAFAVKRFDRGPGGSRTHIEDFAQVRGWYSSAKYDGAFETIAALAYRGHDAVSLHEAVRRITFNLLVGNGDAHLKNWSLIYPDAKLPSLSPAYDLVSTGPYSPSENIGLRFGGVREFDRVSRRAFSRLGERLGVSPADLLEVVDITTDAFFRELTVERRASLPVFVDAWLVPHAEAMRRRLSP